MSNFANFIKDIEKRVDVSVKEAKVKTLKQIREDLLRRINKEGKRTDGGEIGRVYSKRHERVRKSKGKQVSYIDFLLTGKLNESIKVQDDKIVINDAKQVEKSVKLDKMKGLTYDLSVKERERMRNIFSVNFKRRFKKK